MNRERTYYSEKVILPNENRTVLPQIRKHRSEDTGIAPKVQIAYDSERPPRRIEIERKKREYAAKDLGVLLKERGVSFEASRLPLEWFDDEEFETRSQEAWRQAAAKATPPGLPATLLEGDGSLVHDALAIECVGDNSNDWYVLCHQSNHKIRIPRLRICFKAEDPSTFADRFIAAQRGAQEAEKLAIEALYADATPMDEERDLLEPDLTKRILELALSTKALRTAFPLASDEFGSDLSGENEIRLVKPILYSIELARASALARLAMDRQALLLMPSSTTRHRNQSKDIKKLYTLKPAQVLALPIDNQKNLPVITKSEVFCQFRFKCCLTRPELCRVRELIRTECLKLMENSTTLLLPLPSKLPVSLDEFNDASATAINNTTRALTTTWPSTIASHLNTQLREVKKGCFDLQQTDDRVYASSKLKRILHCINLQMQDALRTLIQNSIEAYVNTLEEKALQDRDATRNLPVFLLELAQFSAESSPTKMKKVIKYNTDLIALKQATLGRLTATLETSRRLVTVERRVMNRLFWSRDPVLATLRDAEIVAWQKRLSHILDRDLINVLTAYLTNFDKYASILNMDLEAYVKTTVGASLPKSLDPLEAIVPALCALAAEHRKHGRTLENEFPKMSPNFGLVIVDCSKVRDALIGKCYGIASRLLDAAASAAVAHGKALSDNFQALIWPLQAAEQPKTHEQLAELRLKAQSLLLDADERSPELLSIVSRIDAVDRHFDLLDCAKYEFRDFDDATLRWHLRATPQRLHDEATTLLAEYDDFERLIKNQQDEDAAAAANAFSGDDDDNEFST